MNFSRAIFPTVLPLMLRGRVSTLAQVTVMAAFLAACSGPSDKEKFDGDRISVLSFEAQLRADPRLADAAVPVLPAFRNSTWDNPGGFPSHAYYHLELDGLGEGYNVAFVTGNGGNKLLKAPPIVADEKVFALGADLVVSAADMKTGDVKWRQSVSTLKTDVNFGLSRFWAGDEVAANLRDGFGGGVAYGRGRVIATTGFGEIMALNGDTGEILWRVQNSVPFSNAPTVGGNRVFVTSQDSRLQAFNIETGERIWEHLAITEQATIIGATSVAVSDQIVVAGFNSGEVVALSPINGNVLWTDSLTSRGTQVTPLSKLNAIVGRPVIDRDWVIVTSHGGRTAAIDIRSGERIWTKDVGSIETPWVMGDYILVMSLEGALVSLSREQGRVRWLTQLPSFKDEEDREGRIRWAGPLLAGGQVILASSDGRLVTANPVSGEIIGFQDIEEPVNVTPIVAEGTLYVLTDEGSLIARR
ncbi:MAG: PQQ-binding-like beta-propeller repeat protein [Alphaproteobacteria bacterium]|nr:PQQ-binding-like beta-propeller repeat protein [Alphaproteobacteria bacterium]